MGVLDSVLGSGSEGLCPTTISCYYSQCLEIGRCRKCTCDPGFLPGRAIPSQTRQGHSLPWFECRTHQRRRKGNRIIHVFKKLNTGSLRSPPHALEVENSLILEAAKYMALLQWSSKPVVLGNVCGVPGTSQPGNTLGPGRHQACFGESTFPHSPTWRFRGSRKGSLPLSFLLTIW